MISREMMLASFDSCKQECPSKLARGFATTGLLNERPTDVLPVPD
jgi:hypothetical protein